MDDTSLDREIEDLLAVDPAPDFRARVQQRIAQEPPLQSRGPAWWLLRTVAAGAAVAAAMAIVVLLRGVGKVPDVANRAYLESRRLELLQPPAIVGPSGRHPVLGMTRRGVGYASQRRLHSGQPPQTPAFEVIVDAAEADAWRRLLAGVKDGRIDMTRVTPPSQVASPETGEGFLFPRIVIEPLAVTLNEGVHP